MYNTIILTGVPRSGSTLACNILNSYHNTIALLEPINGSELNPKDGNISACKAVVDFAFESRRKVIYDSTVTTRNLNGLIPDSPVENINKNSELRKNIVNLGDIEIKKNISNDFILAIKDNSFFTAILNDLVNFFPCYGIIRNPLSVLASWATVNLPVHYGHIPAGEKFDSKLKSLLDSTEDILERQIIILNWFFDRFDKYIPKENILKYEETIMSNGVNFDLLSYNNKKIISSKPLKTKNSNNLYKEIDIDQIYNKLINTRGAFWKYYSMEEINEIYQQIKS